MPYVEWAHEPIKAEQLYAVLKRHNLLPEFLGRYPDLLELVASKTYYGVIYASDDLQAKDVAIMLMTQGIDPFHIALTFVPTVANTKDRLVQEILYEAGNELREMWFEKGGFNRIECRVPNQRTRTIFALKLLGFRRETKPGCGLRKACDYGHGLTDVAVLSMIPGDKPYPLQVDVSNDREDNRNQAEMPEEEASPAQELEASIPLTD